MSKYLFFINILKITYFFNKFLYCFLLKTILFMLIKFIKKRETNFDFLITILHYNLFTHNQEKLLKFYPKLLTTNVNLRLTDYQRIANSY
jgi:hypothetical protein